MTMKIMPPQPREQWGIARLFEKCKGDLSKGAIRSTFVLGIF